MFTWVKRIKTSWRQFIHSKFGKYFVCISFAGIFLYLGGIVYAQMIEIHLSLLQRVGLFISAIVGVIGALLLLIEKLLRLETQEKMLQYQEKKLINITEKDSIRSNEILRFRDFDTTYPFDSIYKERESHYKHEKIVLADKLSDLLEKRITYLQNNGIRRIKMIFDSGTTIATILDAIGRKASLSDNYWTKSIDIYTNNIRGLDHLLKYREKTDLQSPEYLKDRYKRLPFECNVLPGKVLSAFQAIVDNTTFDRLRSIQEEAGSYIIGVTTGNYILWDSFKHLFIPMARAGLHPHFKSGLYHLSNEVYLVAPLGKILSNSKSQQENKEEKQEGLVGLLDRFNQDLGFQKDADYESQKLYKMVEPNLLKEKGFFKNSLKGIETSDTWIKKSILVTTKRRHGNMLWQHYKYLSRNFLPFREEQHFNFNTESIDGPYLTDFELDYLPNYQPHQIDFEIPHENLRPFIRNYFETNNSFRTLLENLEKEIKDKSTNK